MTLTYEQESALATLLDIVFSTGLFEMDGPDDEWVHTTGNTINLESMHVVDYEELKEMNKKLNPNYGYEYCV
jgi:hypothetical protein